MNRREALAALVALPSVTRIASAAVAPTDVIVVECDEPLTAEGADRIRQSLAYVWPDRRIVVLDAHMRIKVVPS